MGSRGGWHIFSRRAQRTDHRRHRGYRTGNAEARVGKLDIVMNNAGIGSVGRGQACLSGVRSVLGEQGCRLRLDAGGGDGGNTVEFANHTLEALATRGRKAPIGDSISGESA